MESDIIIRMAEPGDIPIIEGWAEAHGRKLNAALLPRLGVVAMDSLGEPVAAMWLRMDNSVGVAQLDAPVTRPGTTAYAARRVLRVLVDFLEDEARTFGYGVMLSFMPAGLAREAVALGYALEASGLRMLSKKL